MNTLSSGRYVLNCKTYSVTNFGETGPRTFGGNFFFFVQFLGKMYKNVGSVSSQSLINPGLATVHTGTNTLLDLAFLGSYAYWPIN